MELVWEHSDARERIDIDYIVAAVAEIVACALAAMETREWQANRPTRRRRNGS